MTKQTPLLLSFFIIAVAQVNSIPTNMPIKPLEKGKPTQGSDVTTALLGDSTLNSSNLPDQRSAQAANQITQIYNQNINTMQTTQLNNGNGVVMQKGMSSLAQKIKAQALAQAKGPVIKHMLNADNIQVKNSHAQNPKGQITNPYTITGGIRSIPLKPKNSDVVFSLAAFKPGKELAQHSVKDIVKLIAQKQLTSPFMLSVMQKKYNKYIDDKTKAEFSTKVDQSVPILGHDASVQELNKLEKASKSYEPEQSITEELSLESSHFFRDDTRDFDQLINSDDEEVLTGGAQKTTLPRKRFLVLIEVLNCGDCPLYSYLFGVKANPFSKIQHI